jgi:hypothetical protein
MHAAKNVQQSISLSKSHGQNGNGAGEVPLPNPTPVPEIVDIQFESHGSIVLIRGLSEAGQAWLDENVGNDETQYFGSAIAAEPRYCLAIILGAQREGLAVLA